MKHESKYKWLAHKWFIYSSIAIILSAFTAWVAFIVMPISVTVAQMFALNYHPKVKIAEVWLLQIVIVTISAVLGTFIHPYIALVFYCLISELIVHASVKNVPKGIWFCCNIVLISICYFLLHANLSVFIVTSPLIFSLLTAIPFLVNYELETKKEQI